MVISCKSPYKTDSCDLDFTRQIHYTGKIDEALKMAEILQEYSRILIMKPHQKLKHRPRIYCSSLNDGNSKYCRGDKLHVRLCGSLIG